MNKAEFDQRVKHNTKVLKKALKNNQSLITTLDKIYTWTSKPGELHFNVLLRNGYDMIPSLFLGALANINANGIDCYRVLNNNDIEHLEIKTSEINSLSIWKGPKGGLFVGKGYKETQRSAITSKLQASYAFHTKENIDTKNMRTVLFICDTNNSNTFIDAWEMSGNDVLNYLKLSDNRYRSIKFSSFMKVGKQTKTVVKLEGFDKFKKRIEKVVPSKEEWLSNYFKNLNN